MMSAASPGAIPTTTSTPAIRRSSWRWSTIPGGWRVETDGGALELTEIETLILSLRERGIRLVRASAVATVEGEMVAEAEANLLIVIPALLTGFLLHRLNGDKTYAAFSDPTAEIPGSIALTDPNSIDRELGSQINLLLGR